MRTKNIQDTQLDFLISAMSHGNFQTTDQILSWMKSQNEEVSKHEEVLTVIFAQLKRLEEIASENHVTERILLSIIIQNKVILMMMLIHIHFLH